MKQQTPLYLTPATLKQTHDIHRDTLRSWSKKGHVRFIESCNGRRRYNKDTSDRNSKRKRNSNIVTAGSPPKNKRKISKDKLPLCKKGFRSISSLKTSDQGSIGNGKGLKPFWNRRTSIMSKKLWLSTKTDCVDLPLNCSNPFSRHTMSDSWFLTKRMGSQRMKNLQKISCLSLPSIPVDHMEQDDILETKENTSHLESKIQGGKKRKPHRIETHVTRTRKYRLFPDSEQKTTLKQFFGVTRKTYNMAIEYLNQTQEKFNKKRLRNEVIKRPKGKDPLPDYMTKVPYSVRDGALRDIEAHFKSCFTNKKKGNIKKFKMGFKHRKRSDTIHIRRPFSKKDPRIFFIKTFGDKPMVKMKDFKVPEADCSIHKDRVGKFWLLVPTQVPIQTVDDREPVISLDPGVRTFMTGYDPHGMILEYGKEACYKITTKLLRHDMLRKKRDLRGCKRKSMKITQAMNRLSLKITNLVKEMHHKVALHLCSNYKVIILPVFESRKMSEKRSRKIGKKTVRVMQQLSHFSFREYLKAKCEEYKTDLVLVTEEYTSKTCGKCGHLHWKLGSNKTFNCSSPTCNYKADRDVNGARNILLKTINSGTSLLRDPLARWSLKLKQYLLLF
jgi:putative transposase